MKKLLVFLMLGAGLVTVALAGTPLDCTYNKSNQCCIDGQNMNTAISQSTTSPQSILSADDYSLVFVTPTLINDGEFSTNCIGAVDYLSPSDGSRQDALFSWWPGSWDGNIQKFN